MNMDAIFETLVEELYYYYSIDNKVMEEKVWGEIVFLVEIGII